MTERSESERAELEALADAVEAQANGFDCGSEPRSVLMRAASALRRLAAPDHGGADAGVGIKPLEWISCEDGTYHDIECQYEIQPIGKFFRLVRGVTGGSPYICDARSVLAAKTEAKLDYERRIHSTLSKPAPVAANASAERDWSDPCDDPKCTAPACVANRKCFHCDGTGNVIDDPDAPPSAPCEACNGSGKMSANASAEARLREALEPFLSHYETWMERLADDHDMGVFPRHTMGDIRRAREALSAHPHASDCDKQGER